MDGKRFYHKECIILEETKKVYSELFGVDYQYDNNNKVHLLKGWIIPKHINNEDIITHWANHNILRNVTGCQVNMFKGWENKVKKRRTKAIIKNACNNIKGNNYAKIP